MDKQTFKNSGLIEQYVLGLTSPEENKTVEEFMANFPEIREEVESLREAMEKYAMEHAIPPPPGSKEKILQQLDDPGEVPYKKRGFLQNLGLIMALIGCLVFGVLGLIESQGKKAAMRQLSIVQDECEEELSQYRAIAAQANFLNDPNTRQVHLNGTQNAPGAVAVAYWNESNKKGYLNIGSLPPPPTGKTYQLWADVEGEMINAGVLAFSTESTFVAVDFIPQAESLNITLEPAGGSSKPTVELLQANAVL